MENTVGKVGDVLTLFRPPPMKIRERLLSQSFWGCGLRVLCLCFVMFSAQAGDQALTSYPIKLAVWVDETGQTQIEEVSRREFKETNATAFSGGYTRNVHWFKVTLTPFVNRDRLILSYYLQALDDVRLYLPREDGAFSEQRSGDLLSFQEREMAHRDLNFVVATPSQKPFTAYLRVQTSSSSIFAMTAWQEEAFERKNHLEYLMLGLMFGVLFILLAINLSLWRWFYDLTFRYYFFYLLSAIANLASMNGLVAEFFIPDNGLFAHYFFSLSTLILLFFATLFYKYKLNITAEQTPILYWLVNGYQGALIVCSAAVFLDYFTEVMAVVNVLLLSLSLPIFFRAIYVWRYQQASGLIIIALLFGLLSVLASAFTLLGVVETQTYFVYAPQAGILATMLTLQWLLMQRVSRLKEDQKISELRADEAEKNNRLQEKFLAMLTHELKTPLAVIRLAVAKNLVPSPRLKEQAVLAIDDISMIIDRCSNSEKITAGKIQTHTKAVCLPDWISLIIAEQSQANRIAFSNKQMDDCQRITIQTDPDYLRIILSNLLDNALKYSPERSTVNIVLDIIGVTIEIRIDNVPNDAGFPDATQVFEKYYRSAGAHQRIGAGLGLYIVRELVHQLGMNIRYDVQDERVVFVVIIALTA